jgi:hypothetical protein
MSFINTHHINSKNGVVLEIKGDEVGREEFGCDEQQFYRRLRNNFQKMVTLRIRKP